jgi:hypothetical protein
MQQRVLRADSDKGAEIGHFDDLPFYDLMHFRIE